MYKLASSQGNRVNNLTTGERNIGPGVYQWEEYQEWLAKGNTPLPFRTAEELAEDAAQAQAASKAAADIADAKSYAKLNALAGMTPAQVRTWVDNNVNNLAEAKDAIKTLAIAVSILARGL